jgi:hypothetical protein
MSELFKSKVGMLLAGIHLLTVLFCLIYFHLIDGSSLGPDHFPSKFGVLLLVMSVVLSSPWYFLLFYFLIPLVIGEAAMGKLAEKDFILMGIVSVAIGALINAFILYLLGFLLTKAFNYVRQKNQSPS